MHHPIDIYIYNIFIDLYHFTHFQIKRFFLEFRVSPRKMNKRDIPFDSLRELVSNEFLLKPQLHSHLFSPFSSQTSSINGTGNGYHQSNEGDTAAPFVLGLFEEDDSRMSGCESSEDSHSRYSYEEESSRTTGYLNNVFRVRVLCFRILITIFHVYLYLMSFLYFDSSIDPDNQGVHLIVFLDCAEHNLFAHLIPRQVTELFNELCISVPADLEEYDSVWNKDEDLSFPLFNRTNGHAKQLEKLMEETQAINIGESLPDGKIVKMRKRENGFKDREKDDKEMDGSHSSSRGATSCKNFSLFIV
uniref:Rab3 GTPase-activating protein catalytic subunit n=1 Tax=Heterorhabditis bacteriophora TaxID=37862 RepID=A0A1I7WJY6_HETBA